MDATGTHGRRAIGGVLTMVVVASTIAIATGPAGAAPASLAWDAGGRTFGRFGPGAPITIHHGTVASVTECPAAEGGHSDTATAVSADIYIVASKRAAVGTPLRDISAAPAKTVRTGAGGGFTNEAIGVTAPSGPIGPGTYALVYDECQDGRVGAADALFDPAFEVVSGEPTTTSTISAPTTTTPTTTTVASPAPAAQAVAVPPVASFTVDPERPLAGEAARFDDTSTDADGTIASRRWDFGDGTTSEEKGPMHRFAAPGTFTVKLSVTDGSGLTHETSREIRVAARPTAEFSTGGGINVARLEDGAKVVRASSVASSNPSHRAENAIDSNPSSLWVSANGQSQKLTITLAPGGPHVVDRVVLRGSGTSGVRDFDVRLSTRGTDDTDFTTVLTGALPLGTGVHEFPIPATDANHLQLVVKTNWGQPHVTVPTLQLWERPREGGLVSLADGPEASIVGASSEAGSPWVAAMAIDDKPASVWRTANGQRSDQWFKVKLGGDRIYTVDRVLLGAPAPNAGPKDFEVRVSDTSADDSEFRTVVTATRANTATPQEFRFTPASARYVQLFVRNSYGTTCCIEVSSFSVLTTDGANAARAEGVGAFVLSASSQLTTSPPEHAIDASTTTSWRTASGQNANQHLDVLLAPGGPHRIDRVRLLATGGTDAPRSVEVAVSATTSAPEAFTHVLAATLPRDGVEHWFKFAPVEATFVRLRLIDNHGGSLIQLLDFRVFATSQGGSAVAFDDRSFDADGELAAWSWDFGDGTASTERHPVHVYAGPGSYVVRLIVTDADSLTATAARSYQVVAGPAVDFNWSPAEPLEGAQVQFRDLSRDFDGAIVAWRWRFPHTGDQTLRAPDTRFPDNGTWNVTLEVTDSQSLTKAVTKAVTVRNAPPTANMGHDAKVLWGEQWTPAIGAIDSVADQSSLRCAVDWGDGQRTEGACTGLRPSHAYGAPGVYTTTLTVTDKDGGSASDTASVTVPKRNTFTNVYAVPGSAVAGIVDVVARVWDRADFDLPMPNKMLTVRVGSDTRTLTTDASGTVNIRLAFPVQGGTLVAEFAGDSHHNPSADDDALSAREVRPPGDVVFMVDESGSMQPHQEAVRRNIADIANRLGAKVDFQIGLVGFGAGDSHDGEAAGLGHVHLPVTDTISAIEGALKELLLNGSFEPGYHAIVEAMGDTMGYRPGAGVCGVLVADEPAEQGTTKQAEALAALQQRHAVLLSIVDPTAGKGYVQLAEKSGGKAFSILDFKNDPEPVLDALVDTCVAEIVQRPDLAVTLDDGVETASPGQTLTYAVTVTNTSQRDATGVALSLALPPEVSLTSASDGGTAVDGTIRWEPVNLVAGASASRTVTVEVRRPLPPGAGKIVVTAVAADDGTGGPDITPANNTAVDTNQVNAPTEPPVAHDQSVRTSEDQPVAMTLEATDPSGDLMTYQVVDASAHGTLTGTAPAVTYQPKADFHGQDRFTFRARAGDRDSNVATVSVTVDPVNDNPIAVDDEAATDEDVELTLPTADLLANDTDADGDVLTLTVRAAPDTNGRVVLSGDHVVYTPTGNYHGPALFTYTADDGHGGTAVARVRVTVRPVNDAPMVTLGAAGPVDEGGPPAEVHATASDVDGDALTYSWTVEAGSIEPLGPVARYRAEEGPAIGRVEVSVSDGHATAAATTSIEVRNVAPLVDAGPDPRIDEGEVAELASSRFTDAGLHDTHTAVVDWGDGSVPETTPALGGTVAGSHRYDDNGRYAVTVTVTDDDGGAGSDTVVVTVDNVAPVADAGPDVTEYWGLAVPFLGNVSDPSHADTERGIGVRWDFGDATPAQASNPAEHRYADPGTYTARLTATDKDGGVGSDVAEAAVTKRPTGVLYTGSTRAPFGFGTLSAQISDQVDAPTGQLGDRVVRFRVGSNVFVARSGLDGRAAVNEPLLVAPGSHEITVEVDESSHYLAVAERATLVVANGSGKVTGGGLRTSAGGRGGFNVQSDGGHVGGELQYHPPDRGPNFHAHDLTALSIAPDRHAAWFAGVGKDGRGFVAYVEDNAEPGRRDIFRIFIDGTDQTGDATLTGGNVQIHD